MKPGKKGWIKEYVNRISHYIKNNGETEIFPQQLDDFGQDQQLYRIIQPTGLMYGHPVKPYRDYGFRMLRWTPKEKMKFIFTDSLLNQGLLVRSKDISNNDELAEYIHDTLGSLVDYYRNFQSPKISLRISKDGRQKSDLDLLESIVEKRLAVKSTWNRNFWTGFFQNSLLFLDVYFFGLWLNKNKKIVLIDDYEQQQEQLRLVLLKIIASAANANKVIETEEKQLFNFFLSSANLSFEQEKEAREFLNAGLSLEDLDLKSFKFWIVKKYFLELAILTIWADRQVEDSELEFLEQLSKKLGFKKKDLNESMLAIESFVISNWEQVHFLQSKHNFHLVKREFMSRATHVVVKNKNALVQEMRESKELMDLLIKMRKTDLSDFEKKKVKAQLLDILKTIPAFVIIALPGTFLTLPILLKLLPKSAFPSAFSEQD
jgi:hypothetical protein